MFVGNLAVSDGDVGGAANMKPKMAVMGGNAAVTLVVAIWETYLEAKSSVGSVTTASLTRW